MLKAESTFQSKSEQIIGEILTIKRVSEGFLIVTSKKEDTNANNCAE